MKKKMTPWVVMVILFVCGAPACGRIPNAPRAWIDYPVDNMVLPVGKPVAVLSHAYARQGIGEVILSVNGTVVRRDPPPEPGAQMGKLSQEWLPPAAGLYNLRVQTYDTKGAAGAPDSISVSVEGPTATPPPGSDLEITSVESVVTGFKGDTPVCNTRLTYRNAGTEPIPDAFNVQFSFNGVPRWTTTAAGGLPPGETADLTFVFPFEGSPYIGVNLDTENVIHESNEENNAFAEARLCQSNVTPGTPTDTPTPTLTVTPTFTPTFTPTPHKEITCPPLAQAKTDTKCRQGPSKDYDVLGYLTSGQNAPVVGRSSDSSWWVVETGGNTCWVGASTVVLNTTGCKVPALAAPALPQQEEQPSGDEPAPAAGDTTAPPAPDPAVPANGLAIGCKSSQVLVWQPVDDPSGIQGYYVRLQMQIKKGNWQSVSEMGPVTGKQVNAAVECGGVYRWSVSAQDGAGNRSGWSGWSQFSIQLP